MVSDDVARLLVEYCGNDASPQRWLYVSSEDIGALIETVRSTDAILLGVLAATRALLDSGELRELSVSPAANLGAQFAFVTLEGRTEAPALQVVRVFCAELAQAEANAGHGSALHRAGVAGVPSQPSRTRSRRRPELGQ